jgi:hypothetical protein
MKRKSLILISLLGLTFAWAGLVGASPVVTVRADIPFAFSVNNQVLPAGTYEIVQNDNTGMLTIRNQETRRSTIFSVNTPQERRIPAAAKLTFNRYGDQYFLSQVWAWDTGRAVRMSRTEREAARQAAKNLAMAGVPEVVEITGQ